MGAMLERALSAEEFAIAEWLLLNSSNDAARAYLPQLQGIRVTGACDCGCPTVYLKVDEASPAVEVMDNPVGDAFGTVGGKKVGVLLLQRSGKLTCLEIYDLSDIEHPYGLPAPSTLEAAIWNEAPSPTLRRTDNGLLVVARSGNVLTSQMVKKFSEDDLY